MDARLLTLLQAARQPGFDFDVFARAREAFEAARTKPRLEGDSNDLIMAPDKAPGPAGISVGRNTGA